MKTYIVRTHEDVEGVYRVEAESFEAAHARFNERGAKQDWDEDPPVEQVSYRAFCLEVVSVDDEGSKTFVGEDQQLRNEGKPGLFS